MLKDASPPTGIPRCPPSQYAVSGSTRSSPVRTASGGRSRMVTSPTVLPSNSARDSRTRGEGSWIGSLRSRQIPLGRRRCRHPCHESLRGTGGCADLFTARPVRSRCEHLPASQPTHVPRSPHGHNTKVIQILLRPALSVGLTSSSITHLQMHVCMCMTADCPLVRCRPPLR